jgi:ElaB/YqjD/DUF883 family membrane-anchored ribosome-binding protein
MSAKKSEHQVTQEATIPAADQLIVEFKSLMADAEALIHATEGHADGALGSIRSKALETLANAKESLSGIEGQLSDRAKEAAASADDFVHRKPWEAVGVAAGLGLLIGLLIHRR